MERLVSSNGGGSQSKVTIEMIVPWGIYGQDEFFRASCHYASGSRRPRAVPVRNIMMPMEEATAPPPLIFRDKFTVKNRIQEQGARSKEQGAKSRRVIPRIPRNSNVVLLTFLVAAPPSLCYSRPFSLRLVRG